MDSASLSHVQVKCNCVQGTTSKYNDFRKQALELGVCNTIIPELWLSLGKSPNPILLKNTQQKEFWLMLNHKIWINIQLNKSKIIILLFDNSEKNFRWRINRTLRATVLALVSTLASKDLARISKSSLRWVKK